MSFHDMTWGQLQDKIRQLAAPATFDKSVKGVKLVFTDWWSDRPLKIDLADSNMEIKLRAFTKREELTDATALQVMCRRVPFFIEGEHFVNPSEMGITYVIERKVSRKPAAKKK